jgi:hypothetical protein
MSEGHDATVRVRARGIGRKLLPDEADTAKLEAVGEAVLASRPVAGAPPQSGCALCRAGFRRHSSRHGHAHTIVVPCPTRDWG